MDLPSSEESEDEVENKHRGAEGEDEVPLEQKIKVRAAAITRQASIARSSLWCGPSDRFRGLDTKALE